MTSPAPSFSKKMEDPGQQPDNKNTLKKTKFDLRIVQAYLHRAREERPLLSVPVEELDAHLANFIRTHRKQDGSEYEPGTLRGILGSMDRHFERCGYPHAIYRSRDTKFLRTVAAMKEKQSYLKTIGKGSHPQNADPLTEREIELLYATGAIGLHNPTALLYMLFFNIGLHFSLRTMEQHNLKWSDIILKADAQGRRYLEYTKKLSATGRGGAKFHPSHTMRMQIYESPEQPERDVVKAYEKYSIERPEKMKCEDAPFYLTPQPDCRPGYARWFKNLPMGESRIRGIMKHLKMAAGLSPQRKIMGRLPLKSPAMMGSSVASILSAQVKALRREQSLNGCGSNGVTIKKEESDEESYSQDESPDTESSYKLLGLRSFGTRDMLSEGGIPSSIISNSKLTRIKEEWEPEEMSSQRVRMGRNSAFPGQGSVTFHDVAACFSAEEWNSLEDWQKELYKNVMREIHCALELMGYKIVNTDVLLKIKEEECDKKSPAAETKTSPPASGRSVSPDILLRIKQDEVPNWRDMAEEEKEEEIDTANSIPVFDPDLAMWVFKESPDMSFEEDGKDQLLASDTGSCPGSAGDDGVSIPHSAPSAFKGPLPEISTLCRPICPELPRPGKRKRRPPQRRTSEQQPDSDNDEEEPNHRLPCRNPPSLAERKGMKNWTAQELTYQCDLCERTFSDLCNLEEGSLSCPQCSGSLNLCPKADANTGHTQTLSITEHSSDPGFTHPVQGPVG